MTLYSVVGESYGELNGYGTFGHRKKHPIISKIISSEPGPAPPRQLLQIGLPEDFRRVSAIIDIDIVPETHRRVKLMKNGTDKPLGFYIRDGTSYRATPQGVEKVAGIFISRLVPGGLAETTGLLAVNDEVLEVNGIEVCGKTLDQVTDMMVANSSNLIITVKPANQLNNIAQCRGSMGRMSQKSTCSFTSSVNSTTQSIDSDEIREVANGQEDDEDEVRELISPAGVNSTEPSSERPHTPNEKQSVILSDNNKDINTSTSVEDTVLNNTSISTTSSAGLSGGSGGVSGGSTSHKDNNDNKDTIVTL